VADVRTRNGRLLVDDQAAAPNLVLDLTYVDGWARGLRLPAVSLGEFVLQGTDRRLGLLRLAGTRSGGQLSAELGAPAVDLPAVAPYLQRAGLPYAFTAGTGTIRSLLTVAGDRWSAATTLTLLAPTLGGDQAMLEQSLGMPSEAAFAALRERHGEISLQLALDSAGWARDRWLDETVAGAMREALARAPMTPLPEAPLQVGFGAGRTEPGPNADRQLAAIAEILAARPDVVVELRGTISGQDRRWLAEQAVAAEERDEPGRFAGVLRRIGFRDQHLRIRDALAARSVGRPGRLDADDEAALRALVAARPPIADDRLMSLASARSAFVLSLLADRHGVAATRVVTAEPNAEGTATPVVEARFLAAPQVAPW
jgi:hypothetical protein